MGGFQIREDLRSSKGEGRVKQTSLTQMGNETEMDGERVLVFKGAISRKLLEWSGLLKK